MKISVAMATYNGEKYIIEQLESIRTQDLPVDEVIICDDQSKDQTVPIVQEYIRKFQLENWNIEVNEHNLGYIKNFYNSLSKTTGDYIFLCDQDDIWEHNKTRIIIDTMQAYGAETLSTSFTPIDKNGRNLPITKKQLVNNYGLLEERVAVGEIKNFGIDSLLKKNISPGCTSCLTADVKNEYLQYPDSILPHDYLINLLSAIRNKNYFYNCPLTKYRLHDANTIGIIDPSKLTDNSVDWMVADLKRADREIAYKVQVLREHPCNFDESFYERKHIYCSCRCTFLEESSLKNWITMIIKSEDYRSIIFTRHFVGDFCRVININGFLKKWIIKIQNKSSGRKT